MVKTRYGVCSRLGKKVIGLGLVDPSEASLCGLHISLSHELGIIVLIGLIFTSCCRAEISDDK